MSGDCLSCKYSHGIRLDRYGDYGTKQYSDGECRRFPPTRLLVQSGGFILDPRVRSGWPKVAARDWCAEWKEKEKVGEW